MAGKLINVTEVTELVGSEAKVPVQLSGISKLALTMIFYLQLVQFLAHVGTSYI
jgi:hypothetical protein